MTWEARWRDGAQQRSLYRRSQEEATRALRAELARLGRGEPAGDRRQAVGDYLTAWLAAKESTIRPSTFSAYRNYVTRRIVPAVGRLRLDELGPRHVSAMMVDELRRGLAPRTVGHLRAILRAALEDARREGLIDRNAASLAKPPRIESPTAAAMTAEEAERILQVTALTDLDAPVAVALLAGLRRGEVLGLAWSDVDLDGRTLRVRRALQRTANAGITLGPPKSAGSRRAVSMTRHLVASLSRQRASEGEKRAGLHLPGTVGDELVFTNGAGEPIDPSWLSHAFHDRLATAGLPPRRFHDLRHGCAALLLAGGTDLKVVSAILGHSSIRLTADTYAGVVDRLREQAADALDRLLG